MNEATGINLLHTETNHDMINKKKEKAMKLRVPLEENFRAQWKWAARTGKSEEEWPGFKTLEKHETNLSSYVGMYTCFACDCRRNLPIDKDYLCGDICPIKWLDSDVVTLTPCVFYGSLYNRYEATRSVKLLAETALEISELPWRDKEVQ